MFTMDRRSLILGSAAVVAASALSRGYAQSPTGLFKLDPLPYPTSKNEPYIDAQTMEIHHDRHHAAYVNNLNGVMAQQPDLAKRPLLELLTDLNSVPEAVRTTVRNNGGGHANHTMFWQIMGGAGGEPKGDVKAAIDRDFGGFDKLQDQFNAAGTRVFGSGWVFVTVARDGKLALVSKPNQDTPLMDGQRTLMGNDVWEHAYYLKYQNRRPDYLKAWWNVVNWDKVSERYSAAKVRTLAIQPRAFWSSRTPPRPWDEFDEYVRSSGPVKAVATDESRLTRSRTPLDARASRPCCRKRRRPACGTNCSWILAAVLHRRDSTRSRAAHRPAVHRYRPRSRGSAQPPWSARPRSQLPRSRPQLEQ